MTYLRLLFFLALVVCSPHLAGRGQAHAKDLGIDPIAQQTPEWCWAAASEMVLSYYNVPNLNPAGNFQCGIVGAQGGMCSVNCAMCLNGGGTTQRIAAVIQIYLNAAKTMADFDNDDLRVRTMGILSPQHIIDIIDDDAPIIAGISPNSIPFPPGMGFSQHAVVIVGYEGDHSNLRIIINDPYPYPPNAVPYLQIGGQMLQPGQYRLPYQYFVAMFHYGNSITFN
jgi:hypothetical protein